MEPIQVSKPALLAVLAHADTSRRNLSTVAFEKSGRMIATDGHRLVTVDTGQPLEDGAGDPPVLLDAKALKAAVKAMSAREPATITFGEGAACLQTGTARHAVPVVEETYPNWRAVLPTGAASVEPWYVDPAYLADAANAAKRMGIKALSVTAYGPRTPVVFEGSNPGTGENFRAVVMPKAK